MGKTLQEMSLEELWQLFPIQLKPHDTRYREWYEQESRALCALLGEDCVERISHIGSTAVAGLTAKPIIDILLEVAEEADPMRLRQLLQQSGWICMAEQQEPYWQMSWNKGYTPEGFAQKVFHLHIRHFGDWDELYFRDYLRECPSACEEYVKLKCGLAQIYRNDRDAYTRGKSEFVHEQTLLARAWSSAEYGIKKV